MGRASSQDGGEARRTQDGRLAAARTYRARLDRTPPFKPTTTGGGAGGRQRGAPPLPPGAGGPASDAGRT